HTQLFAALHLLLSHFIRRSFDKLAEANRPDVVKQLFFANEPVRFERFETAEHPRLIRHWLRRLSLAERPHRLHLKVSESGEDELAITLHIEHGNRFEPVAGWLAATNVSENRVA